MLKALIKPVIIFVLGLGMGFASQYLGFDVKSELCKSSGPSIELKK